ncbi:MAG: hypothetical protein ACLUEQ_12495 [Cloacibacillus evryensis]
MEYGEPYTTKGVGNKRRPAVAECWRIPAATRLPTGAVLPEDIVYRG